ncbi:MAG: 2-dehydro-3-deoxygalactonokinase [Rudaea sp.]|uniref:2-dehydro-3-deoxygalactonokinase n=1 Tax=Rudaea sp. TaxID=2136325 RepID=UPI0039E5FC54
MIAIDWGTTSLRAFRIDAEGRVVETRRSSDGVLAASGRFEAVLRAAIDGWEDTSIVMSGMIGSRQGWREAAYVECPAGIDRIAAAMAPLDVPSLPDRRIWLVPGLSVKDADGTHDVMRGEETQICGLLRELAAGRHLVCLPGTHSKHVELHDGRIARFRTAMTGELFDLLRKHSLLSRLMDADAPHRPVAFARGVDDARRPRDLLNQLFAVRTLGLFGTLSADELPSYLSGLLIGHELNDLPAGADTLHLIAADRLLVPYGEALARRGVRAVNHADHAAAHGLHALAVRHGLV